MMGQPAEEAYSSNHILEAEGFPNYSRQKLLSDRFLKLTDLSEAACIFLGYNFGERLGFKKAPRIYSQDLRDPHSRRACEERRTEYKPALDSLPSCGLVI